MAHPDTNIPTIDLGRLPRRRRSWPWEMGVLLLVLTWSIVASLYYFGEINRTPEWASPVSRQNPDCDMARQHIGRGREAYLAENFSEAIKAFTAAMKADGCYGDVWDATFNLAQAEFAAGEYEAAIHDYTAVLNTRHPDMRDKQWILRICRRKRAIARQQIGDLARASPELAAMERELQPSEQKMDELAPPYSGQESYLAW